MIYNVLEFVKNEIKNKNIVGKEINFDFSEKNEDDDYHNIILFENIKMLRKKITLMKLIYILLMKIYYFYCI